jgi:hypothetical protein
MYAKIHDVAQQIQQLSHSAKFVDFLKDYQHFVLWILAGIGTLIAVAWRHLAATAKWYWNARQLRSRVGSDFYSRSDIQSAMRYFIEPSCQSLDPSGGEDFRRVYSAREPAFKVLDSLFGSDSSEKYSMILGDSGMGKTTLLLNYYARFCRKRNLPYAIALIPLGHGGCDSAIASLKNRSDTVLLLDAFDEDIQAIQDFRTRLSAILNETRDFRNVLITCRTQFFATDDEIPKETGLIRIGRTRAGQTKEYAIQKLYISTFNADQVRSYLRVRFPIWRFAKRRRAASICLKFPDLTMRPMLLAHIQDILDSNSRLLSSVQIYEQMIRSWLTREKPYIVPEKLRTFSEDLAVDIYTKREMRGVEKVPPAEALELAHQLSIPLELWQLRGRSLLNRDADGNLKFAHRTFMEYLFVFKFTRDPNSASHQIWTDQMKKFWWERLVSIYLGDDEEFESAALLNTVQSQIDQAMTLGDVRGLETLSLMPMERVPSAGVQHSDLKALDKFCSDFVGTAENEGDPRKLIPGLFQRIKIPEAGFRGTSAEVVVDFVTRLMWDPHLDRHGTFEEVTYPLRNGSERIYGLTGWRLPSLAEVFSLLRNAIQTCEDPSFYFGGLPDLIWTADTVAVHQIYSTHVYSNRIACAFRGERVASPQTHAHLLLVRPT